MARIVKFFGPPGTGKTTKLTHCVNSERQTVPVNKIAYLSFSVSAKEVIKDRLQLREKEMFWFRTIHGAALTQLGLRGMIVEDRHLELFWKKTGMKLTREDFDAEFGDNDFNICRRAVDLAANMMIPLHEATRLLPDNPKLYLKTLTAFADGWAKFKKDEGLFDYTDMLTTYAREGAPLPVTVGFLDEAQDNSPLQWACVEKMFANCERIYMAGDDDQTIFTFIGASEYGFLDHPCDEEIVLSQSYRVPTLIGQKADGIIRQLSRRKDKVVQWKDHPGVALPMNLGAFDMDWDALTQRFACEEGPAIMVLSRHRKEANKFSADLEARGVSHSLHGVSAKSWPEAKIVHSLYSLLDGKDITAKQAEHLAVALGRNADEYRDLSYRKRVKTMQGLTKASLLSLSTTARSYRTKRRYAAIANLVHQEGYETLGHEPPITVTTMHASKGREAPLIIIVPECNNIVRQNINSPTEIRLAYVVLTRAIRAAHIMIPQTDNYIHHFF